MNMQILPAVYTPTLYRSFKLNSQFHAYYIMDDFGDLIPVVFAKLTIGWLIDSN